MSKQDRCGDCKFWIRDYDGAITGDCHAMPPVVAGQLHHLPTDYYPEQAVWPETRDSEWCGKFELSDEASFRRAEKFRQRMIDARKQVEPSIELKEDAEPLREAVAQFMQDEMKRTFIRD